MSIDQWEGCCIKRKDKNLRLCGMPFLICVDFAGIHTGPSSRCIVKGCRFEKIIPEATASFLIVQYLFDDLGHAALFTASCDEAGSGLDFGDCILHRDTYARVADHADVV